MVYTCYEMIRDCRAGKPEGWTWFLAHYVPVIRRFLAHYFPERAAGEAPLESVLADLCKPESALFQSLDPAPEPAFVAALRQHLLRAVEAASPSPPPEVAIELETLAAALEPLALTEKLAVWFETMRYSDEDAGRMLRMSPQTVASVRERAAELIRPRVDAWRHTVLSDNGPVLGAAAAALAAKDCPPPKVFLDRIGGRATWSGREEMERHVTTCWFCLDRYCRLLEVVDALRAAQPLGESEIQAYRRLIGMQAPKRPFWKR